MIRRHIAGAISSVEGCPHLVTLLIWDINKRRWLVSDNVTGATFLVAETKLDFI